MTLNLRNEDYDVDAVGLNYKLVEGGVIKLPESTFVPENAAFLWREYEAWLDVPNTPDPEFTLAELKERKIDATNAEFLEQVQKNKLSGGTTYFGSFEHAEMYQKLIDEDGALTTKPTKIYLPDRTITTATKAQLQTFEEEWTIRVNESYDNFESLVNQINAAPDEATLDAIDITAGWPA